MRIQSLIRSLDYFFLILTSVFLALGSIGIFNQLFLLLGMVNALIALGYKLIQKGKIEMPKYFTIYLFFIFLLLVHTWLMKGDFLFFGLFLSGALIWVETYNFRGIFSQYFSHILIVLGLLMGITYFYSLAYPIVLPNLVSLFSAPTDYIKHSNIGDLWALILVVIFYTVSKQKSYSFAPLLLLGGYFLLISYSRAAIVSLACGIIYIFDREESSKKLNRLITVFLISAAILFIYASLSKSVLFSRPYYLKAVTGIIKYPLGTGMGNFTFLNGGSNYVHNIILEVISGMGVFSTIFVLWLYKIVKSLFSNRSLNTQAAAVFLTILVNFFFSTNYTIPAFIWIWFVSLALI